MYAKVNVKEWHQFCFLFSFLQNTSKLRTVLSKKCWLSIKIFSTLRLWVQHCPNMFTQQRATVTAWFCLNRPCTIVFFPKLGKKKRKRFTLIRCVVPRNYMIVYMYWNTRYNIRTETFIITLTLTSLLKGWKCTGKVSNKVVLNSCAINREKNCEEEYRYFNEKRKILKPPLNLFFTQKLQI